MKTGFICASGFNLVGVATRNGRRLIAVVLGAHSGAERAEHAAQLLESGFNASPLSWLMPSLGSVDSLTPINAEPLNLRDEMCGQESPPPRPRERRRAGGRPRIQLRRLPRWRPASALAAPTTVPLLGARVVDAADSSVHRARQERRQDRRRRRPWRPSAARASSRPRGRRRRSANAGATPAATAPTTGGGLGPTILPANGFSPPAPDGALAFTNPPPDGAAAAPGAATPSPAVPLPRARPKRHRQTAKK